ncbi:OmpA family protein [Vibrio algarum]|uniref:OmpA family protein n=1 Tax=Vibrio algarum TaxID=3020714 RepID=A0ABT4YS96_9VIBR|nr:OmpA family protein [Vibrio sp. KJ40-1]MDB1123928.1 OmpA family protein [Vibrio sp. KJ40-1]
MDKKICSVSIIIALFSASSVLAEDEFAYRATPVANQISDLIDDDRDGVINARDICPDTPENAFIDNDGCEEYLDQEENLELKILFEHNSAQISPAFLGEISTMAEFLEKYPETSVELQGHTSVVGDADYNLKLSESRALEVQKELVSSGVSMSRVRIVGYGEAKVVDGNDSPVSHAVNRRVVARVVGYDKDIIEEWTIFSKRRK